LYHAASRLPHLLSPADYFESAPYDAEVRDVFRASWQLVGSVDDAPADGDFLTCDLFGAPVLVRNCSGEYRAFANVCAHRHCLLTSLPKGHAARMRCQYHGWEYDDSGTVAKIPAARNFAPLNRRTRPQLGSYRAQRCGKLIFVCLAGEGISLRDQLGDAYDLCRVRCGDEGAPSAAVERSLDANWKIPVENSLESYHVPMIHGNTFREDPGDDHSTHGLGDRSTEFSTSLPFAPHNRLDNFVQATEKTLLRLLGLPATGAYRHMHCFPNFLVSFTDASAIVQSVLPTSPTTSRLIVRQFHVARAGWPLWKRTLARAWGKLSSLIVAQIIKEDTALFNEIQKGVAASRSAGMLGRCEERIHQLQKWLMAQRTSSDLRPCRAAEANCDLSLAESSEPDSESEGGADCEESRAAT